MRNVSRLDQAVRQLKDEGFSGGVAVFDATDPQDVAGALPRSEAEIGAVDILINNVGIQIRAPLEDFTPEHW